MSNSRYVVFVPGFPARNFSEAIVDSGALGRNPDGTQKTIQVGGPLDRIRTTFQTLGNRYRAYRDEHIVPRAMEDMLKGGTIAAGLGSLYAMTDPGLKIRPSARRAAVIGAGLGLANAIINHYGHKVYNHFTGR